MKSLALKRILAITCSMALLLQVCVMTGYAEVPIESDTNGDSFTKSLEIRTDMVHDNPGGNPYVTKYDDISFLADLGLSGKVFFLSESAHLAIDWQGYDEKVFPVGSEGYNWVQQKQTEYRAKYIEAKAAGLKVYFMMDFISLPKSMKDLYGDAIMTNGKIDINKPKTLEIMREMMREVFEDFPELDGIYPRYGESYVGSYSGYHFGNNPIGVSGTKAVDHATLLNFFRNEVCEKLNKEIVYRTWSTEVGSNSFTTSKELYLEITNQVEPHDNLYIAIKHTAGDFWRNYIFNETIGVGKHKQIIEIQCSREYEGKGAYPNYVAGSVINGFKEYEWQMGENVNKSLRDVVNCENSLIAGVWTWSRGGGWGGPYTNGQENPDGDELWSDLNAYVIHKWAQDTSKTDKSLVKQYAKEILGMNETDAESFYRLATLSSDAVLYGIGTDIKCVKDAGWISTWTRDASTAMSNEFKGNVNAIINTKIGDSYPKLEEIHKSVELYKEIIAIANSFNDNVAKKPFIQLTAQYGYYRFATWERLWTAAVLYKERTENNLKNAGAVMAVVNEYNDLYAKWHEFKKANPACPTVYNNTDIISTFICSDEVDDANASYGPNTNLALNKTAIASYTHNDFVASNITNGQNTLVEGNNAPERWNAGNRDEECWIYVDLGSKRSFNKAILYWNYVNCPNAYDIQISNDAQAWQTIKAVNCGDITSRLTNDYTHTSEFEKQTARYVRIYISKDNRPSAGNNWTSLVELELYDTTAVVTKIETSDNLALNKNATANYTHGGYTASYITNGTDIALDTADRWNAGNRDEECWIYVDLGEEKSFNRVILYWNYNNCPTAYDIQVSNDATSWTTVKTVNCGPISSTSIEDNTLSDDFETQTARYIRIYVSKNNRPSGGGYWVSLVELEVYMVVPANASQTKMFISANDAGYFDMLFLTNITKIATANDATIAAEFTITNTLNNKGDTVVLNSNAVFKSVTVSGIEYMAGDFTAGTDNDYVTGFILNNVKPDYMIECRFYGVDGTGAETWSGKVASHTIH